LERASRKLPTTRCSVLPGMWCLDPRLWSLVRILFVFLRILSYFLSLQYFLFSLFFAFYDCTLTHWNTLVSCCLCLTSDLRTDVRGQEPVLVGGIWWLSNCLWSVWMCCVTLVSFLW
jgi:hypothetical protein